MNLEEKQIHLLYKLWRNRRFGEGHMLEDNVLTGFPKHEKGIFKSALDDLVKKGVVCIKKIAHGDAFYIDPKQRVKVKNVLKKYYPFL